MNIQFSTEFMVDVPEETGNKVITVIEDYINNITKLIPRASAIRASVKDSEAPERRTA